MSSVFATGSETVKVWSLSHSTSLPLSAVKSKPIADLIWLAGGHQLVHCNAQSGLVSSTKFSSGSGLGKSKTLTGLPSGTCCLASLRSSSHFLAAGLDHAVRLIAVGDGSVERTLMGHSSAIRSISASCSDGCVAVAQDRAAVVLHRLSGNTPTSQFTVPGCGSIQQMQFSRHQENILAVACDTGKCIVWDVNGNFMHHSFASHSPDSFVNSVSFSPRNPLLMVSAGEDRQLVFHDVPKKIYIRSFKCESSISTAAILHDGFTVVAGTDDGLVLVYDLRAGDAVKNRIAAHASSVAALAGRPLTASSGSTGGRQSKSSSASSSSGRSTSKLATSAFDRPTAVSSKAPEASPVLLPTGAGTKASTETPPLRDIESQPSSARSASHVAKSSDPPSASQLSAQHLLRSRGPLVSSIGQTSAPIPSPSMSSTSGPPSVARAANKPLSTLKNFRDSDLFSPLKPAVTTSAVGGLQDHLASSPQLSTLAEPPHQPHIASITTGAGTSGLATTALRSLQQAEGMETSSSPSAAVCASPSLSVLSQQRFSPHITSTASSSNVTPAYSVYQGRPSPAQHSASSSSSLSFPDRSLMSREAIDGSEADYPTLSQPLSATSPRPPAHRHILGAARNVTATSTRPTSTISHSLPPTHSATSVQALASMLERLPSPNKTDSPAVVSAVISTADSGHTTTPGTATMPVLTAAASGANQPIPFHTAVLQRMIDQAMDELRLALHQHIRNVHVNLIRQFCDQTAELMAGQDKQYEITAALLAEVGSLREEVQRLQERY